MQARRWADWVRPTTKAPHDAPILFGSSCKAYGVLTCGDVHPRGPMPPHTECLCGVCLTSSRATEYRIAHSVAPLPTEPEHLDPPREGWWTCEPTRFEPDPEGRAGGVGKSLGRPGPLTRKQRRKAVA